MSKIPNMSGNSCQPKRKNANWTKEVLPYIQEELGNFRREDIVPSLRTMFYRLLSRHVMPTIKDPYGYLSDFTAKLRRNSLLPESRDPDSKIAWIPIDCFSDDMRGIIMDFNDTYVTPQQYIDARISRLRTAPYTYKNSIPRWHKQIHHYELWTEKYAMTGTFRSYLKGQEVTLAYIRGYNSVGNEYKNFMRIKQKLSEGKKVHIRYFGDLDPSGESIEEVVMEYLPLYGINPKDVDFKRVAVLYEHIDEFGLPKNPDPEVLAKLKRDTRRKQFMRKHGLTSEDQLFQVEVDALAAYAPNEFRDMVLDSIKPFFNERVYRRVWSEKQHSPCEISKLVRKSVDEFQKELR